MYWIAVTQRHIDTGAVGRADACPVFFACQDAGLPIYQAGVAQLRFRREAPGQQEPPELDEHGKDAYGWFHRPGWARVPVMMARTPGFVSRAMRAWDRGEGMRPFGFWLEIEHESCSPRDEWMQVAEA